MNKFFIFINFSFLLFMSCTKQIEKEALITVTIEPQRYFVEQLCNNRFLVNSMVPSGMNPENYDPTPAQMISFSRSVAYFQIGYLGFENVWIEKLKKNYPDVRFFNNGENIEYIQSKDHKHNHDDNQAPHDCSGIGIDPHTWSSPKQAHIIVTNMYDALINIDPEKVPFYQANYEKVIKEIDETDKLLHEYLDNTLQKSFIIYHPALSYLARDYGLTQYSIETDGKEPSVEQIKILIDKAQKENIKTIFIQEEFDKKNAETIAKETGCKIITINPLSYNWKEEMIKIAKALANE